MPCSSALMALAWLGHLRDRHTIGFGVTPAQLAPRASGIRAERGRIALRYGSCTGAQMASFHLAFGVVAVAVVARFVLGEHLTTQR